MHSIKRLTIVAAVAACLAGGTVVYAADDAAAITVAPVKDLRADFMYGADISMLDQVERGGAKFYDQQGVAKDCLQILKENGVNWIRLRLWHTPVNAEDVIEGGKTISHKGDPIGGGNNDLATTIRLATRAKALGLKFMLDIHYSDFWADPDKQNKPAAWKNLSGAELEAEVYRYTAQTLEALRKANVYPDMVQVGNELNGGMLWPDGKTWQSKPDEKIGGDDGFAALLRQGIKAVRDADPKRGTPQRTKVAVHLANGADNTLYRRVFDGLIKRGIDFDIIGLSFYPYWHGTLEDLRSNLDDISARYGKEVVVLETAYAYTTADGDGFPNLFSADNQKSGGYKATVQGQASLVRDVIDAVAQVPGARGAGVFYWEPDWIPAKDSGWRTGEGNAWDNQAMFDFNGRALPSLAVFKRVRDKNGAMPKPLKAEPLKVSAFVGEPWEPPQTIKMPFSDDAERNVFVQWDKFDPALLAKAGHFQLKGKLENVDGEVVADIEVAPRRNVIDDPSFEKGTLAGWTLQGDADAGSNERNPGNAHTGLQSFHYWKGAPFKFELTKKLTGLRSGTYTLRAWLAGGGGEKALQLFARDCAGDGKTLTADATNTGWQKWKQYEVKNITVAKGECTIGLLVDGETGNWGNMDDVEFVPD